MAGEDDDKVGFGNPPRRTRFKPGQSGNPKGRPKGAKNFATALSAELNGRISVSENGKRKKITRREVIVKQLVNRAVSGDHKVVPILLNETRTHEAEPAAGLPSSLQRPADRTVMEGILERVRAAALAQKAAFALDETPAAPGEPDPAVSTKPNSEGSN